MLEEDLEEGLSKAMFSPYFPVQLEDLPSFRKIRSIHESEVILYEDVRTHPKVYNYYRDNHSVRKHQVRIRTMHSLAHPNGGVYVYRLTAGEFSATGGMLLMK